MKQSYMAEYALLKKYIFLITATILASYSVYFVFDDQTIEQLKGENSFFELGTALFFTLSGFLFLGSFRKNGNIFLLLLFLLMILGAGEELSWGQHLFNYNTPSQIKSANVQGEFNIHNIQMFNTDNFNHSKKTGLKRLLEINFLFRIFITIFGVILPLLVYHIKFFRKLSFQLKLPVPPIAIGIFFFLSWIGLRLLLKYLPLGKHDDYYFTASEIFEFLTSFVFFMIGIYFYTMKDKNIMGFDIKTYLEQKNESKL